MKQRSIREDAAFAAELANLIPDARQADAVLDSAKDHLYLYADIQEQVEETELYYKIIFYPPAARYLVFYFTIEKEYVTMRSVTSFPVPPGSEIY